MELYSRSRCHSCVLDRELKKDPIEETKEKKGKRHYTFKKYLVDYTVNSNLHGLKYIGEKERTTIEKCFWIFMFTSCVVLCAILIRKVYKKWDQNPVIVTFAEHTTPIWQIPHPAVTICIQTKSLQSNFNYTKYFHIYNHRNDTELQALTEEERHLYEDSTLVCNNPQEMAPTNNKKFGDGKRIVQHLRQVSPNISDYAFGFKWNEIHSFDCVHFFSPILTDDGHCYTFNTLGVQELYKLENLHQEYTYLESTNTSLGWSLEDGYLPTASEETYPHRGLGHGIMSGLSMIFLVKKIDLDYLCKGATQGFKILLHNPAELPRMTEQFIRIPLNREVDVAVKPKMMTTSEELKSYTSSQRQCYYPNEHYLQYFKIYTQSNCEIECLTNFTYARCGCVHFSMPRDPKMKVCHAGSRTCLQDARNDFAKVAIQSYKQMNRNKTLEKAYNIATQCKCLPACTSITYEAEVSQAKFNTKALFQAYGYGEDHNEYLYSGVIIFFKEAQFITYKRSELYGLIDFLANCGGLLGLCMGFSILSVAEIVYFLTLRIITFRKRNSKKMIKLSV